MDKHIIGMMDKQNKIDIILERVMFLSNSFSASPYSISSMILANKVADVNYKMSGGFSEVIVIALWKDYNVCDVEDYLLLSKEYLSIPSEFHREKFLTKRLEDITLNTSTMHNWMELQASFALGLVLSVSRQLGRETKPLQIEDLEPEITTELGKHLVYNQKLCYIVLI